MLRLSLSILRFSGINEAQRDEIINLISTTGVSVNVHYIPMAMLTLFRNLGYNINDYPNTFRLYENEISLPIYNGLSDEQVDYVIDAVVKAYQSVVGVKILSEG
jgi:dTDP-4-amino-4,6-dideoxygalactose transaminase